MCNHHADETEAQPIPTSIGRRDILRRYRDEGWLLLGLSWEPQIAESGVPAADVEAGFARMCDLLELAFPVAYCPHAAGPPVCWCRKPLPGMGVAMAHAHRIDLARSLHVGKGPADRAFAERLGMAYLDADSFFVGAP